MIVLDASAAVELLLCTPAGQRVALRIADPEEGLHASDLLDVEVAQVVRRLTLAGKVPPAEAEQALADLAALDLMRYAHLPFLSRIWQLRQNLSAYDASYVALAEALDCCLVTHDPKIRKAPGHSVSVEVI